MNRPALMSTKIEPPWWHRIGSADAGFHYADADGNPLDPELVQTRILPLAIPPAWTDVCISPDEAHKIQAWGHDRAGRKQYIYSPQHIARRERRKWSRVLRYARVVPLMREVTNEHLSRPGPDREKVLATMVRLMSRGFFRVGSERYAVQNRTFGICTLRKRHLAVTDNTLVFRYTGKRRIDQRRVVADTPLVEVIHELLRLPGARLFQYRDPAGPVRAVTATMVNRYLRESLGGRYTSKDLRTFGATVRAATILADLGPPKSEQEAKRNVALCCRLVAMELGNTPAICRSAYIHPAVLEEYRASGRTIEPLMRKAERTITATAPADYYPEEAALIRFLERRR
jgi:DNA topoisomerase-1